MAWVESGHLALVVVVVVVVSFEEPPAEVSGIESDLAAAAESAFEPTRIRLKC